jgi:hypothetical protein
VVVCAVGAWLLVVGAGCGSSAGDARQTTVAAARTTPSAVVDGPLDQLPGSPFVADGGAAWYTDFQSLARYDLATSRWSAFDLPHRNVRSLTLLPSDRGSVLGVATTCVGECAGGAEATIHVWRADASGITEVAVGGDVHLADPGGSMAIARDRAGAVFAVVDGVSTVLVEVDDRSARATRIDEALPVVCRNTDGYLAIRNDVTTGRALAPASVVHSHDGRTFTAVELTDVASGILDGPFSSVCAGDRLAIVGPTSAVELSGAGTETAVASDADGAAVRQLFAGPAVPIGGDLWAIGNTTALRRDATGWHRAELAHGVTQVADVRGRRVDYPFDISDSAPAVAPTVPPGGG